MAQPNPAIFVVLLIFILLAPHQPNPAQIWAAQQAIEKAETYIDVLGNSTYSGLWNTSSVDIIQGV